MDDGFGPRHIVFSPNGKNAYLLNELSGQIIVYNYANGKLTPFKQLLQQQQVIKMTEVVLKLLFHPTANFYTLLTVVYAKIFLYIKFKQMEHYWQMATRQLVLIRAVLMVDPTGRFLLVASQNGNTIQIFTINKNYGLLENGSTLISDVQKPVCLQMVPVN